MHRVRTAYKPADNAPDGSTVFLTLTRQDVPAPAAAQHVYFGGMRLLPRDRALMVGVATFGSLTTSQIDTLFFNDLKSRTPCTRALKRLTEQGMLARVPIRLPSNERGGSPMGCYQIGPNAWPSFYATRYRPIRDQMKLMHTLLVADVYIATRQAERSGWLDIIEAHIEADAWCTVAGVELRPDMLLDVGLREKRERRTVWLEIDRGGERQKQIAEKIERYIYAYHSGQYAGDVFPEVLFLATDAERVKELRQIVSRSDAPDGLITVERLDSFPQVLHNHA
jgi:hypothetical protein